MKTKNYVKNSNLGTEGVGEWLMEDYSFGERVSLIVTHLGRGFILGLRLIPLEEAQVKGESVAFLNELVEKHGMPAAVDSKKGGHLSDWCVENGVKFFEGDIASRCTT